MTERILMMAAGLAVLVVGCTSSALPGAGGAVAADAAVVGLLDCAGQADCDDATGAKPPGCKGKADCDDHNGCTVDNCDLKTGCSHEPMPDDSPCDAGTACSAGDKCKAGLCVAATGKPWDKTWGGTASDEVAALVGLPDGGFVLAGATASKGAGSDDMWLFRVDASGGKVWEKTYGGADKDFASGLVALNDGFALSGRTNSKGAGSRDAWLVRTDASGGLIWEKTFGGAGDDAATSLAALPDGFALAGFKSQSAGGAAGWLVRVDAAGNELWDKTWVDGRIFAVAALPDGLVLAGYTGAPGGGAAGMWLVRTDAAGEQLWEKSYGGSGQARALAVLPDGFALAGFTGGQDISLVRTDALGNKIWDRTWGGDGTDMAYAVASVAGGLAVAGKTAAKNSGNGDLWLIRTDMLGNTMWDKTFGGAADDHGTSLVALADGIAVAGGTNSKGAGSNDAWLVRTDAFGNATCAGSATCAGLAASGCDDGNSCTRDLCGGANAGCYHGNVPDGGMCGAEKTCTAGACSP